MTVPSPSTRFNSKSQSSSCPYRGLRCGQPVGAGPVPALPGGPAVVRGTSQMRISRLFRLNRRPGSTATNRRPRAYVFIRETSKQQRRCERRCAASVESEASRPARNGEALGTEDHVSSPSPTSQYDVRLCPSTRAIGLSNPRTLKIFWPVGGQGLARWGRSGIAVGRPINRRLTASASAPVPQQQMTKSSVELTIFCKSFAGGCR